MKPKNVQNDHPLTVQEQYLRKHKNHHRQVAFLRIFLLGIFLILWEISADAYWIDSFFFSSPRRVVLCLIQLWIERSLPMHIGITLLETILSFLLVFVISLLLATLLWFSDKLSEILEPYLVLLNSLPKSALAPLFIVWLGTGINTIVIAGISVAVFGSIISFYTAFHQVDPEKEILIRTLGETAEISFSKSSSGICSHTAQHHQGQYRSVFSRCHHRRISGSQTRAGLSHHLRFPGVPAGYGVTILLLCVIAMLLYLLTQSLNIAAKASQLIIMFSSRSAGWHLRLTVST
ncbi:MAG: ABC transporter permease [Waltera sp.]